MVPFGRLRVNSVRGWGLVGRRILGKRGVPTVEDSRLVYYLKYIIIKILRKTYCLKHITKDILL